MKNNMALFYGAIVVAVIAVALSVYYIIPSISHILASPATGPHYKHALLFAAIAIVCVIGALVTRPKSIAR